MDNQQAQGDVLVTAVAEPAENIQAAIASGELKRRESNVVAFGEVTGHHHKFFGDGIEVYEDTRNPMLMWVVAPAGAELRHVDEQDVLTTEHDTVAFPAGIYQVDLQRVVDPLTGAQVRAGD